MAVAVQPLVYQDQADLSAGAFPGLEVIPPNGAEDIVNGVLADDGSVFRRGGSSFKSNADVGGELLSVWDGHLIPGRRTLASSNAGVWMLANDDATPNLIANPGAMGLGRWTVVGRMLLRALVPPNQNLILVIGGAQPFTPDVTAGTATVTQFSPIVTGVGTSWGGVAPGSVFIPSGMRPAVVESVQSATQLTLAEPYPNSGVAGSAYSIRGAFTWTISEPGVASGAYPTYLAQMFDRLVVGNGRRVSFSRFIVNNGIQYPSPLDFLPENYHELPEGAVVAGLQPLRDTLYVFTTAGTWALSGLALEITDDFGNMQQRLEQVARDLVLWGDAGITSYRNALVVPALDEVYLFDGVSAPQAVTGGARKLYRSYVKAGYQPGQSIVFRGHLLLPILNGTSWVDTMVWRLDAGAAFTRWDNHGGQGRAYARRVGDPTRQPLLLAANGQRVVDLTGSFDPDASGSSGDANGSGFDLKVTTRTLNFGDLVGDMWRRFRARFEGLQTTPNISLEYATGKPSSAFTLVSGPQVKTVDNEQIYSWHFNETTRAIRFRLTVRSGGSREVLRSFQAGARLSGHHRP